MSDRIKLPQIGLRFDPTAHLLVDDALFCLMVRAKDDDIAYLYQSMQEIQKTNRPYYDSLRSNNVIRKMFDFVIQEHQSRMTINRKIDAAIWGNLTPEGPSQ